MVIAIIALGLFAQPFSTSQTSAQDGGDAAAGIDELVTNFHNEGFFSGAVLVARDGEVILSKGYGMANREWAAPAAPDTRFRIGPLTKQFTGTAILKLQEEGALSVEDPICNYLDECPDTWQDVTIHHLLTHTSGIHTFTGDEETMRFFLDTVPRPEPPEETIRRIINEPLDFAPGEDWLYSNSGYVLLGLIIETASGHGYEAYLRDTFFEPLGMVDTRMDNNQAVIERRAQGYGRIAGTKGIYLAISVGYSAAGLLSTVQDLHRWNEALFSGEVVSPESLEAMWDNAATMPDGSEYGYGLQRTTVAGQTAIGHTGWLHGFISGMRYFPDADLTIIALANTEEADVNVLIPAIARQLLAE
jgi:CubicO group peptidase (beta-lactamase class C family)